MTCAHAGTDPDPWLVRWLPLIHEHSQDRRVLELGCGSGRDTRVLHAAGLSVIGVDSASNQIEAARAALPGVEFHTQDIDRAALTTLFAHGWRPLHIEERIIHRYARPKSVWEALFECINP